MGSDIQDFLQMKNMFILTETDLIAQKKIKLRQLQEQIVKDYYHDCRWTAFHCFQMIKTALSSMPTTTAVSVQRPADCTGKVRAEDMAVCNGQLMKRDTASYCRIFH